jgi:hypothetical protein
MRRRLVARLFCAFLFVQTLLEQPQASVDVGLHRSDRLPQECRDLGVLQPLDVTQYHTELVPFGEGRD